MSPVACLLACLLFVRLHPLIPSVAGWLVLGMRSPFALPLYNFVESGSLVCLALLSCALSSVGLPLSPVASLGLGLLVFIPFIVLLLFLAASILAGCNAVRRSTSVGDRISTVLRAFEIPQPQQPPQQPGSRKDVDVDGGIELSAVHLGSSGSKARSPLAVAAASPVSAGSRDGEERMEDEEHAAAAVESAVE
jgi:hypothetical protein